MQHIGILAHSADGAALCFLEMCREGARRLGTHMHPEITMSIQPMGEVLDAWERMDLARLNTFFARTARHLLDAGCDFFVCPDNTAHIALEAPGVRLPLPALHIADIVAERAARARDAAASDCSVQGGRWKGPSTQRLSRGGASRNSFHRRRIARSSIASSSTSSATAS